MDTTRNTPELPDNDDWLKEFLADKEAQEQTEQPVSRSAAMDLELEQILAEAHSGQWDDTHNVEIQSTQMFTPPTEQEQAEARQPIPDETESEKEVSDETPVQKTRPKREKGAGLFGIPHILATAVWIALILAVGVSLGRVAWVCAADLLAFGRENQEITITVLDTDDVTSVSKKLERAGLVRYAGLFELFAQITGKGDNIGAGTYVLNSVYDYNALINAMRADDGPKDTVEVMFPEGYNCAEMFALLEKKGVCSAQELEEYAANGTLKEYWFLEDVTRGHKYSLEGFLAPDTYEFYLDDEPKRVLEKFLDEFDSRFNEELKAKFETLNDNIANRMKSRGYSAAEIADAQLTVREVVILASIVEKETAGNRESYQIASVFYNRLTHPRAYPKLESDATILYAINFYNKGELITDAQINASPYHTYTHNGLTPGPIANPGLNSLGAALEPEDTDYYYFIYDKNAGGHRFSKTQAEHEKLEQELGYND